MGLVKGKVVPDGKDDYKVVYECEGFEGMDCESIAEVMASMGSVSEKKATEDSMVHKIPIPVPASVRMQ